MIYFLIAYLSIFFTSLVICMAVFYQVLLFIKENNYLLKHDKTGDFSNLPEIRVTFLSFLQIFLSAVVMSLFIGWRIVFKALFRDDFILEAAKKIYIRILVELNDAD